VKDIKCSFVKTKRNEIYNYAAQTLMRRGKKTRKPLLTGAGKVNVHLIKREESLFGKRGSEDEGKSVLLKERPKYGKRKIEGKRLPAPENLTCPRDETSRCPPFHRKKLFPSRGGGDRPHFSQGLEERSQVRNQTKSRKRLSKNLERASRTGANLLSVH